MSDEGHGLSMTSPRLMTAALRARTKSWEGCAVAAGHDKCQRGVDMTTGKPVPGVKSQSAQARRDLRRSVTVKREPEGHSWQDRPFRFTPLTRRARRILQWQSRATFCRDRYSRN